MLFILVYRRVWLIGACAYCMQHSTYKYVVISSILEPDHDKSNLNGGAMYLHKSVVRGHHSIIYKRL